MESIREKLSYLNPEIYSYKIMDKKGYGFEKDKPIVVKSVMAEYELIKRFHLKGYELYNCILKDYSRESIYDDKFTLIDHFELLYNVYDEQGVMSKLYDVYFCCYKADNAEYVKNEKIKEFNEIINNNISIQLPDDFTIKFVETKINPPYIIG